MIVDRIDNASHYYGLGGRFERALRWLAETDLTMMEEGKHAIEGDELFALVQKYTPVAYETCSPEGHRIYADIHYMVKGEEAFGYARLDQCVAAGEYDPNMDIVFFKANCDLIRLSEGTFCIALPQDVHVARCIYKNAVPVTKAVIKVKL
ncbi:MAG: YhcH/YjgK/YiaL family protein [Peptococcaceae bacterium]|jgi:YhcH/YjgK/YiaL family protein|nr:YhcH/YjgK/YiaL family protein [Peptococcaceae bacterium]MDH7525970.1 YhcH/YjgK/YiaL family protein [Peptococcaceae bacterium]